MQLEIGLLSKVFPFIFICDYTYFDTEMNCLKTKLELMRYHLEEAFCIIILAVYSTGCYDKCLKKGEHQKLF